MASNPLVNILRIKELRQRIFYTIGMLIIFRLGAVLPIPGIDPAKLSLFFQQNAGTSGTSGLLDYLDFFAGGAFKNSSIFMLGIMPYISMSIIMQLMLILFPALKKMSEEEGGRKKIQSWTKYGTIIVCLIQSFAFIKGYIPQEVYVSNMNPMLFLFIAMVTVTTGTMLLTWMGEQITERGIGNGISLIIFAGIVARVPFAIWEVIREIRAGNLNVVFMILMVVIFAFIIAAVVYEQQGQRKIPVHYAKRVVGRRMYGAQSTYIPFKINPSGVIPVIFASSVMAMIATVLGALNSRFSWNLSWLSYSSWSYQIIQTALIIFFAFFYTQVTLNPVEIAKNIRENGGSIPGIRTDKIEEYLKKILNRIILPGSLFLAFINLVPFIAQGFFSIPPEAAMLMGGTSLLILVGVDLDTMSQIEGHLRMHHQGGLVKKGKLRSRNL